MRMSLSNREVYGLGGGMSVCEKRSRRRGLITCIINVNIKKIWLISLESHKV